MCFCTHGELGDVIHLVGGAVGAVDRASEEHLHGYVEDVTPLEASVVSHFLKGRDGNM